MDSNYISAEAAKGAIRRVCFGLVLDEETEKALTDAINEIPAEDVKKNVYGENRNDEYAGCDQFICSNCGIELQGWDRIVRAGFKPFDELWDFEFNFCPNCGADMRGKEK